MNYVTLLDRYINNIRTLCCRPHLQIYVYYLCYINAVTVANTGINNVDQNTMTWIYRTRFTVFIDTEIR